MPMLPESERPLLEVHNIYAGQAGDSFAIQSLSLELKMGEIVSVIGRNGAGKSTFLKVLFGLLPLNSGRILYNDRDISQMQPRHALRAGIAFVPQYRSIFPDMSVYENLEVALFWQSEKRDIKRKIEQCLSYFSSLRTSLQVPARLLGGAEQRLLEIARAILWQPRLLMIDEPSLNLAPSQRELVFDTLRKLNAEMELSILMAEQNTQLGISIAERVCLLHLGKIIYEGSRQELLNNPKLMKSILGA